MATPGGGGNDRHSGGGDSPGATDPISHADSGSSPLVPVLIAIALLAALSFAAVYYRQRRQTPLE